MKVVIAEEFSTNLSELVAAGRPDWKQYDSNPKDKQELIDRLKEAEAASSFSIKYDAEIFKACPGLKYLAIPAVGAEYAVDMYDAKEHGVTVMNCPGYNSFAVAEIAVGLILAVYRQFKQQQNYLQDGMWNETRGHTLQGKRMCIIGNGNVSKALQEMLKPWAVGLDIIDSKSTDYQIDAAVSACDILTLCCPLNDKTKGMISTSRISNMKTSAVIINVARGAVVNEDAMYDALVGGRLYGAGLDVFSEEPSYGTAVTEDIKRFVDLDNVAITPHIAGASFESGAILGQMIYDNLLSCESGSPINVYS